MFGWRFQAEPGGWGYHLIYLGDEVIGGLGPSAAGRGAAWTVYLAAKDVDAVACRVKELGGRVTAGPFPAGQDGRLLLAADPQDAPVGFWEGHRAHGVVLADEPGATCAFELYVPDEVAAGQFHEGLFGAAAGYSIRELDPTSAAHWLPYLGVTDCAAAVRRVAAAGGDVVRTIGDKRAVVRDPWRAAFGLIEV